MNESTTPSPSDNPLEAISLASPPLEARFGIGSIYERRNIIRQRWVMLVVIGIVFVSLNAAVLWLILYAIRLDSALVTAHPDLADKRMITSGVFMALIAATVAQTGAITFAMARFLFPAQLTEDVTEDVSE
jgi:hypothetical protein